MPALAEIRPSSEIGRKEKERPYARRAVSHVLLGVTSTNLGRFHPDNTTPLTPHEKQTLASAKPDALNDAFSLAESISLESRRNATSDANTWVTRMTRWGEKQLTKQDEQHEERMNALQAVGLINGAHEVTANTFYNNYFYDRQTNKPKSDVQKFVRDIAAGCIEDGVVNMGKLEQRVASVQGLLTSFGKTNRVDLLIQDFAISYGILSQPDTKRQQFINDAANNIANPLPHNAQERVYLTALANIQQLDILPQDDGEEEIIPLVLTQTPSEAVKNGKMFVAYYEEDPNGQGYRPVEHDMKRNLIYKELGRGASKEDLSLLAAGFSTQHLKLIHSVENSLEKLTEEERTNLITGARQNNPLAEMRRFTDFITEQVDQGHLSQEQYASILASASYLPKKRREKSRIRSQQKGLRENHRYTQLKESQTTPFRLQPGEQLPPDFWKFGAIARYIKNEQTGQYEPEYIKHYKYMYDKAILYPVRDNELRKLRVSVEDIQRLDAAEIKRKKTFSFGEIADIMDYIKYDRNHHPAEAVTTFLRQKGLSDQEIEELDTTSPLASRGEQKRAVRTQRRLTPEVQTLVAEQTPPPPAATQPTKLTELKDFGYGHIATETGKGMAVGFGDGLLKGGLAKRLIPIPHVRLGLAVLGAITGGIKRGERAAQQKIEERRERIRNGQQ